MALWHDLRHGWRVFVRNPGFTAVAVISIAFGAGANVAIFSFADALLLRPMPVPRPSGVLTVGNRTTRGIATLTVASYPDYVDMRNRSTAFAGLAAFATAPAAYRPRSGGPPSVRFVTAVSHNFFDVLGLEMTLGRGFHPDEERLSARGDVVVLSYGAWQADFAGDPDVIGTVVRIAGIDCTVVGVAPERFTGMFNRWLNEVAYVPLAMWSRIEPGETDPLVARDARVFNVKGRLAPGVTLAEARAELTGIGDDLAGRYPKTNTGRSLIVQTELEVRFARNPLDTGLVAVLSVLSIMVLAVACANVGGMLASRAPARAREIAIRLSVGAGRARLVRQLLTESVGLAIAGCAGGIAVGYGGIVILRQIRIPTELVAAPPLGVDERALWVSLSIAVGCALLFGLGPALQTTRVDLVNALKAGELAAAGPRRLPLRQGLVIVQIALSMVLLTIASYAYEVFHHELLMGPGFRTTHLAKADVNPAQAGYSNIESGAFFLRALDEARQLPGVTDATVTSAMPLFSFEITAVIPEGQRLPNGEDDVQVVSASVDERYFDVMNIPLLAGRGFRPGDATGEPVVVVNDTFARRYWPAGDAVGRRVQLAGRPGVWLDIVGIVRTSQYWYPGEQPQGAIYFHVQQRPARAMALLALTDGDSAGLVGPLRALVRRLDPDVPVYDVLTIEDFYSARVLSISTIIIRLIAGMGAMGMVLTMIGLHGLVSYAVARRTREIGIRVAMGADALSILRMVISEGLRPVWSGLALGLVLSSLAERWLPSLVPLRSTFDERLLVVIVPVLFVVTAVATLHPASRAARMHPTTALRQE